MSNFYCVDCGMLTDDPHSDLCEVCVGGDNYCLYCGADCGLEETCESCQEDLDTDAFDNVLTEEDEEYLRGPFAR